MAHAAERAAYDAREDALEAERTTPKKKRKAATSPTQRTMAECRKRGWTAQIVEHRVPRINVLRDLFGVIDVVALAERSGGVADGTRDPVVVVLGCGILGIQACSGTDHARRRDKILAEPRARQWVEAGGKLELWSWSKQGARGKRKLWTLRVEAFRVEDWGQGIGEIARGG